MKYYNILNFKKEPFSNSPEPEFLFQLPQYSECLQKLELAVRLRRGINVVIGDIGTGKTTLCRKLIQNFSSVSADSTDIETHLLLDPSFNNPIEFLQTVAMMLGIKDLDDAKSEWHLKEKIKNCLFDKGIDEKKIVVLIIDEGQKIPEDCLEILREFLNYETNKFKLLQIVIFAQKEFQTILKRKDNLVDRINLFYHLKSLNFKQTMAMINYRLNVARDFENLPSIFSFLGFVAVYISTAGYPRKVVFLCHQVVLKMIIRNKKTAGFFLVRSCVHEIANPLFRKMKWTVATALVLLGIGISLGLMTLQSVNQHAKNQLPELSAAPIHHENKEVESANIPVNQNIAKNEEVLDVKMPQSLGQLAMTKKRTIWWTIYNVYGDTDPKIMKEFFAANPHLEEKSTVAVGTTITLPSIPVETSPLKTDDIIVVIESGQDLETMYNIFRNNPDEKILPPLAFLSCWNKKNGFEFTVVIDKRFKDVNAAKETIGKLPPSVASKAKILSQWDADTVFFNRRTLLY